MPDTQSFKFAVAREVRAHLGGEVTGACAVSKRLDAFMNATPCIPAHVTPLEAAEQVICGVS
ncbi:hypothetical protein [Roseivivax sp. CAU 1761]